MMLKMMMVVRMNKNCIYLFFYLCDSLVHQFFVGLERRQTSVYLFINMTLSKNLVFRNGGSTDN
jgi:hypothetical protein